MSKLNSMVAFPFSCSSVVSVLGLCCSVRVFFSCGTWASHYGGFSCGAQAPEHVLSSCGHRLSCYSA